MTGHRLMAIRATTRVAPTFIRNLINVAHRALLAAIALLISYLPARKASRVDPVVALRYD